jgi:hypothetical protein
MSIAQEILGSDVPAISKIAPIRVWDHGERRGTWVLPDLSHTEAIPTLWKILDLIRSDWTQAAAAVSLPENCNEFSSKASFHLDALESLKPRFVQCLFSYINFFFTLENGFQVLLSELGTLNHELDLKLKVPKAPKRPAYIEKLWLVRNHTVVHWGGPEKKHELDSRAGRLWAFSWPGDATDLTNLAFGSLTLVGARDHVLKPILETHDICLKYLKKWDDNCVELFEAILSHLPMKVGAREYVHVGKKKGHKTLIED